jgi:hypothetical protein
MHWACEGSRYVFSHALILKLTLFRLAELEVIKESGGWDVTVVNSRGMSPPYEI